VETIAVQRRDFFAALAGAVATIPALSPRPATAQQAEKVRHIGVLMGWSESDPAFSRFVSAFLDKLTRLGWTDGRNVRIEQRWTNADLNRTSAFAKDLVAIRPDVILTSTTPVTAALKRGSSTVPIVLR
jgi:putative ABC transport system substrate-binding protein